MNDINDLRAAEERAYHAHVNALNAVSQAYHEHDDELRKYVDATDKTRIAWKSAMKALREAENA